MQHLDPTELDRPNLYLAAHLIQQSVSAVTRMRQAGIQNEQQLHFSAQLLPRLFALVSHTAAQRGAITLLMREDLSHYAAVFPSGWSYDAACTTTGHPDTIPVIVDLIRLHTRSLERLAEALETGCAPEQAWHTTEHEASEFLQHFLPQAINNVAPEHPRPITLPLHLN